jgi:triphosphoribosyl-dephospho-CoA synthase
MPSQLTKSGRPDGFAAWILQFSVNINFLRVIICLVCCVDELYLVTSCGVQACLLEVSARKPGNIYPGKDFENTYYGDFILGSKALKPVLRESAVRGFQAGRREIGVEDIQVGFLVKKAVLAVKKSHKGGNTHLGIAMFLVPLCAAAGFCLASSKNFARLRACLKKLLLGTTVQDSLDFFDAVNIAGAGGLGKSRLDVKDRKSKEKLKKRNMTFLKLMKYSSRRDGVARELASNMPVVFNFVVPNFRKNLRKTTMKKAIVQTYLQTLAKYPDTLISRKVGAKKAKEVSKKVGRVLQAGGIYTKEGRIKIKQLDKYLRSEDNKLNPGATADLITAGLFLHFLKTGL